MKCANPDCENHRPSGFMESLWSSRGLIEDGKWFCSSSCHAHYLEIREAKKGPAKGRLEEPSGPVNLSLGEILVSYGIIDQDKVSDCLANKEQIDQKVGQALLEAGLVTRDVVLAALSKQKGIPWVDVFALSLDQNALALLDEETAQAHLALPFGFSEDKRVLLATPFCDDSERMQNLQKLMGHPIFPLYAPEEDLVIAIGQVYAAERLVGKEKKISSLSTIERRLGQIMLVMGLITSSELEQAIAIKQNDKARIGQIMLRLGFISERDLAKALGKQTGCMYVDLSTSTIPSQVIRLISGDLARKFQMIPVKKSEQFLMVATDDPTNTMNVKLLEQRIKIGIRPIVCTSSELMHAIERYYGE
ncbi:hypothetical protein J7M28_04990 [bacterium]|nr:hypothetical protein [bacterium]